MRKSLCSGNSQSVYNGIFNTENPLSIGTIVKIKDNLSNSLIENNISEFCPDTVTNNIGEYENSTLIDIINHNTNKYILGAKHSPDNYYFIIFMNNNNELKLINIGSSHDILSFRGNICIYNEYLFILIYHKGVFNVPGKQSTSNSGILITLELNVLKILGFRGINLDEYFMLFGGCEESNREEPLFLINGLKISRFNPGASNSWTILLQEYVLSACTAPNMIILLFTNYLSAIDSNNGKILWNYKLSEISDKCRGINCVATASKLYLIITDNYRNNLNCLQAKINHNELIIISQKTISQNDSSEICTISEWTSDISSGYIICMEKMIIVINDNNIILSEIKLDNISIPRTYRFVSRHNSQNIIVLINSFGNMYINNNKLFIGINNLYAGMFIIKQCFPKKVGVVIDILDENKVHVALDGVVTNIFKSLISNKIYMIDMNGKLSINQNDQSKPFLIVGKESYSASLIYNRLC